MVFFFLRQTWCSSAFCHLSLYFSTNDFMRQLHPLYFPSLNLCRQNRLYHHFSSAKVPEFSLKGMESVREPPLLQLSPQNRRLTWRSSSQARLRWPLTLALSCQWNKESVMISNSVQASVWKFLKVSYDQLAVMKFIPLCWSNQA